METLSALFVGRPLNILAVALAFLAGHLLLRLTSLGVSRHPRPLLFAAAAWALYAAWEWLVKARTPEANIRVDLVLIWPALLIVSIVAAVRALR